MTATPYLAIIAGLCILLNVTFISWLHERSRRTHVEKLLVQAIAELVDEWADEGPMDSADSWTMTLDEWRLLTNRHQAEQMAEEQEEE